MRYDGKMKKKILRMQDRNQDPHPGILARKEVEIPKLTVQAFPSQL